MVSEFIIEILMWAWYVPLLIAVGAIFFLAPLTALMTFFGADDIICDVLDKIDPLNHTDKFNGNGRGHGY